MERGGVTKVSEVGLYNRGGDFFSRINVRKMLRFLESLVEQIRK